MDEVQEFEAFVNALEPRLRRALIAVYGFKRGREATAEALGWAWENRGRLDKVSNKAGFLFRVGQSKIRRRKEPVVFVRSEHTEPWVEPGLGPALATLPERQRIEVVLVHGFSLTLREVAELS